MSVEKTFHFVFALMLAFTATLNAVESSTKSTEKAPAPQEQALTKGGHPVEAIVNGQKGESIKPKIGRWFGSQFAYRDEKGVFHDALATYQSKKDGVFLSHDEQRVTYKKGDLIFQAKNKGWYLAASENGKTGTISQGKNISRGSASSTIDALIQAVSEVGGRSVNGMLDSNICSVAQNYANKLARNCCQDGHAGMQSRAAQIGGSASEISGESWGWENGIEAHARECVKSWMGSSGHKQAMMSSHRRFCYAMAQGRNGKFYCVGLFAN